MAEKLTEHPILLYLTFVLPIALLFLAMVVNASLFPIMALLAWLGIAFVILYLPISSDDGSSN